MRFSATSVRVRGNSNAAWMDRERLRASVTCDLVPNKAADEQLGFKGFLPDPMLRAIRPRPSCRELDSARYRAYE